MKTKKLPKLRKISYKNKKNKIRKNESNKKRRLAINEGVKNESKRLNITQKQSAQKKKARFNILRIYNKNKSKKSCIQLTKDMKYMDKKYKLGKTKNICKLIKNINQNGGVLSKYQATALTQSIQKIIGKDISPEIVKSIADKIPPKLHTKLVEELLKKTRQKREQLNREASEREDGPDLREEDAQGINFRCESGCFGCDTGTFNEHAHCTACIEGRL